MIELAIGLTLAVLVYLLGMWNGRVVERRRRPTPFEALMKAHKPFEEELAEYLKRYDFMLTTRELAAQAWPNIIESPYAPRGKAIFVHPDTLSKLTRDAGPELIKAFQEWGDRHRYTSPFLKTCTHEWPPEWDVSHAFTGSPHKCTLGVMTHGPKCVCRCGATAAYVEKPDGSIDKTFEEPK